MIDAYVEGRPIPRSSSSRTRLASMVARGRLRLVPLRLGRDAPEPLALVQGRQDPLLVLELRVGVVGALDVGAEEAREGDHLARDGEARRPLLAGVRLEARVRAHARRVAHLRGDRALPDQIVEAQPVVVELAAQALRRAEDLAGRADRLVRLLRTARAGAVAARLRRDIVVAVGGRAPAGGPRSAPRPRGSSSPSACR